MTAITPNSNIKEKGILLNTMVQVVLLSNTKLPTKTNLYVHLISCPLLFCISYILNCIANISKIFEIHKFLRNYFINYFITLSLSVFYCIVRKSSVKIDFKCYLLKQLSITTAHQPVLSIEFVIIPIET